MPLAVSIAALLVVMALALVLVGLTPPRLKAATAAILTVSALAAGLQV